MVSFLVYHFVCGQLGVLKDLVSLNAHCSLLGILGGYLIVVTLVAFDVQIKRKTLTYFAVDNQACDLERKKNTRFLQSQGRGIKGRTF